MFEELEKGWQWALSRFWNLFSVVGVIATFYFGLFYIPDYAKENLYSKSALAQDEILEEVGEKLFHGQEVSLGEIESSIEQKEVFYKINFPFSTKQTLLLIRNDFAKNSYIPLEKRNEINLKVQSLIEGVKDDPEKSKEWTEINLSKWISIFLVIASGILGFLSIIQKNKKDAEVEIDLDEENIPFEEGTVSRRGYDYSQMVGEALKELNLTITKELKATPQQPVYGPEFEVTSSNGDLLVETKAYRQKVGINTMRGFLYMLRQTGKPGVLVSSSTLTIRAREMLKHHNKNNSDATAHFVLGTSKSEVKTGLQAIVCA